MFFIYHLRIFIETFVQIFSLPFIELFSSSQMASPTLGFSSPLTYVSGGAEVLNRIRLVWFCFTDRLLRAVPEGSLLYPGPPRFFSLVIFLEMLRFCYFTFCSVTHFVKREMSVVRLNVKWSLQACGLNSWIQLVTLFLETLEAVGVGATAGSWSLGVAFEVIT